MIRFQFFVRCLLVAHFVDAIEFASHRRMALGVVGLSSLDLCNHPMSELSFFDDFHCLMN